MRSTRFTIGLCTLAMATTAPGCIRWLDANSHSESSDAAATDRDALPTEDAGGDEVRDVVASPDAPAITDGGARAEAGDAGADVVASDDADALAPDAPGDAVVPDATSPTDAADAMVRMEAAVVVDAGMDATRDAVVDARADVPGDIVMPTDGGTDPIPASVTRIVDCQTVCSRPTDAVANAAGTTVYFLAQTATGAASVFTAPITGGTPTQLGTGFDFPVSIAISDDDQTLYVADLSGNDTGRIYSLAASGGTPVVVAANGIFEPSGIAVAGNELIVAGHIAGTSATPVPAVFRVARSGGTATVIVSGAGLVDPSDVALGDTGTFYTFDPGRGIASGFVGRIAGTEMAGLSGLVARFPAGLAASRDGAHLLVAGWVAGQANRLTYVTADGTVALPVASTDLRSPTGIGRARNAAVYVVADELAGAGASTSGSIFAVR